MEYFKDLCQELTLAFCCGKFRRHIDTDCNGSPRSSQAVTPSGLKPKSFNVPRTSTPINSPACRRMRGPRPPFVTPYRKQVVSRNVSPLVRCTAPGRPILEPLESPGAADVEPSSKKPKISSPNTTCNSKSRAELSEVGLVFTSWFVSNYH